ncbi:hypothetical protein C0995_016175, partial [Termitomyces sp. Mi166
SVFLLLQSLLPHLLHHQRQTLHHALMSLQLHTQKYLAQHSLTLIMETGQGVNASFSLVLHTS